MNVARTRSEIQLRPPRFDRRIAEHHVRKERDGGFQTLIDGGEGIFVLDTDDVVIADQAKRADNLFPNDFIMAPANSAEEPGTIGHLAVTLRVQHSVAGNVLAVERGILGM